MVQANEDWDDSGWDDGDGWDDNDVDMDGPGVPDVENYGPVDEKGFRFVQAHVMKSRVT